MTARTRALAALAALGLLACHGSRTDAPPQPVAAPAPPAVCPPPAATPPPAEPEAACARTPSRAIRWLDSNPHGPLAIVEPPAEEFGPRLRAAPQGCCAAWRDRTRRWTTVDAYGQPVGQARITEDWLYDATDCYQPTFEQVAGKTGVGLYVSADAGYTAPGSMAWTPTAAQVAALAATVKRVDDLLALPPPAEGFEPLLPLAERALFFRLDDEADTPPMVVVGGQYLMLAYLIDGRWVLVHLDQSESRWPMAGGQLYRPLAAFDMDGDGTPEVVYHEKTAGGESWQDVIITLDRAVNPVWRVIARSIGGATV